ncbi:HEAT repeat domain-containing protein [Paucidesulfovibrio longus]|uniref:HEAT repeat domain-containing protein n=1 Tax=Paucidesulfovibrio longus TaxID=889 RepID=UPI0003B6C43C|nr:HEAT repeat domain-containing protein [Paucidesulfovibrio longus]
MSECGSLLEQLKSSDTVDVREAAFLAGEGRCVEAVAALAALLEDENIGVQEAADVALRKIGGPATVEALVPLLRSERAPVRNLAMDILRQIGVQHLGVLVELVPDADADVRIFAADILGATGSVRAVEPLVRALLHDPEVNVRYQAAVSLGELGSVDAAAALGRAMKDEEWVQYAAVEALAKIGHSPAVDALLAAMNDCSDLVLSMVVDALGSIGTPKAASLLLKRLPVFPAVLAHKAAKAIVGILGARSLSLLSAQERETLRSSLLGALDDEDPDVQDAAMLGLTSLGGEEASWAVLNIAAGLDPDVHSERLATAIRALAGIGLTEALRKGLESNDLNVATTAVAALAKCRGEGVSTPLMEQFWDKPLNLQRTMIAALLEVGGPEARQFCLDILSRHYDGKVFRGALRFLGEKLHDRDAGDVLFSFLEHKYNDVKEAALDACIAVGGERMTRRFLELVESPDDLHRLMGVYALGRMDGGGHIDVLERALSDPSPDVRKVALEAVAEQCDDVNHALPLVAERLRDENAEVRLTAVKLMGLCGHPEVVPHLLDALHDPDDWVCIRAMESLGSMRVAEAVPALQELVTSPNRLLGIKAVEAMGAVGDGAAFQALLVIAGGDDPELADAAQDVIEAMQNADGGA